MVAVPALIALGLSKGGFAGVGVIATPLTALYLPPLEAAALILPVLIVQDVISVWWYRRDFDPWNLKVHAARRADRHGTGVDIRGLCQRRRAADQHRRDRHVLRHLLAAQTHPGRGTSQDRTERRVLGRRVGLHIVPVTGRRTAVPGACAAATTAEAHAGRNQCDLLCDRQRARRSGPISRSDNSRPSISQPR